MKYFPLLWAGLWRKRTRTTFTLLSVVAAFLLYGLLQGVNAWLGNALEGARVNRLYTVSRISFVEPLPISYVQRIETVPGVDKVAYFNWFGGYYQDPKNQVQSYVADPQRTFEVFKEWKVPKDQLEKMIHTRNGAIVGEATAKRFNWKIGDHVPLKTPIWTRKDGASSYDFEIVGIYTSPTQNNIFLINYDFFDEARAFGQGKVAWIAFSIKDPTQSSQIAAAVDKMFRNSPNETKTQNEKEFAQAQIKQLGDIGFMVNAIVGAVLFTLLFLTGNTMMQSVRERIPELAVLKTVGFTDGMVTALVLAESILLCVIAAFIGLGLAALIFPGMRSFVGGDVTLPLSVLGTGALAAILLALVSALPPAWRANRLAVVDALAGR
ncbi:MAG TPA: ABC transporter permease [Steroidobacteraceae bacterium]|nr:ABC transporter permease [Steroidobacteraceae bacterium]